MIDEIYEKYRKRLSDSSYVLKHRGIDKDINELKLGINSDIENILIPFKIFDCESEEISEKIKEAYGEIFKEGIYLGLGFGKILKLNYCRENAENYCKCLNENPKTYDVYEFKMEVFKKIIPPVKVIQTTKEDYPKEIIFHNEIYDNIRSFCCVNIETILKNDDCGEINSNAKQMKDILRKKESSSILEDDELKNKLSELKDEVKVKLYEKFFDSLGIELETANEIGESKVKFNKETAEDMFASPLFNTLEGEFKLSELIFMYLLYVFNQGETIGLLNGCKIFIEDLQNDRFNFKELKTMSGEESFDYVKEGLK